MLRYVTGKDIPDKMFARAFIAQVIGSVDLVTIVKPVEIIAKPTNRTADIKKARITEGMFAFSFTLKMKTPKKR